MHMMNAYTRLSMNTHFLHLFSIVSSKTILLPDSSLRNFRCFYFQGFSAAEIPQPDLLIGCLNMCSLLSQRKLSNLDRILLYRYNVIRRNQDRL